MKFDFVSAARQFVCMAFLAGAGMTASAQSTGLLYDPEPPADSAYVRVIHLASDALDVQVDGKVRVGKLGSGEASDYMVLPAGKHAIALHKPGQGAALYSMPLNVVAGRAMTIAIPAVQVDAKPVMFEDKTNSNKLKAILSVYHLDMAGAGKAGAKTGALDILTADGSTKVFSALAPGTSAGLAVNPLTIELIAANSGDKQALARTQVAMAQGGSYSILLLPAGGKLAMRTSSNKIERFSGK